METNLIILSTDSVDRYGYRIMITALEMMIKDRMKEGIPMLYGHDQHKPIGWAKPFALYLEPHLTRLLAVQYTPVTADEGALILKNHNMFRSNKYYEASKKFLKDFDHLLRSNDIQDCQLTNIGCLTANKKDIAKVKYPFLFENHYRDGLVPFSTLFHNFEYLGQGVFKDKSSDFAVFAHKYFRKSESIHNTLNAAFLDEFLALKDNPNLDIHLRIDKDQLGYAPSFKEYLELEYQWGPKYNDNIESIKEGMSRHECDASEREYYGFSRSEFLWEWDKPRQKFSFQMEELKNEESPLDNAHFNCKYIHSVYDKTKGSFDHFDGAIRTYDFYEMIDRLDKDFKSYGKQSVYTKLFKVNGILPLDTWKLLVTLYLRGNPIIYEYFGLKKEIEALKAPPLKSLTINEQYIPYKIDNVDGIRLLVSYFNLRKNLPGGRFIDSFDVLGDSENSYRCIDYYFLEFKKSLLKLGEDIEIPEDVLLMKSTDNYWNIPLIMHNGPMSWALFEKTVKALVILFNHMISKKLNFNVSITLGIVVDEKAIQVSTYGNITHLNKWLKDNMPFPANEEEFTAWLVAQRKYLEQFPYKPDRPLISEIIQMDGVLYAKRVAITSKYEFEEDPVHGFKWAVNFTDNDYNVFNESGLDIVPALQIKSSVCADTGENYFTSSRSRWIDDDLKTVNITGYRPIFLHWSQPARKRHSTEL